MRNSLCEDVRNSPPTPARHRSLRNLPGPPSRRGIATPSPVTIYGNSTRGERCFRSSAEDEFASRGACPDRSGVRLPPPTIAPIVVPAPLHSDHANPAGVPATSSGAARPVPADPNSPNKMSFAELDADTALAARLLPKRRALKFPPAGNCTLASEAVRSVPVRGATRPFAEESAGKYLLRSLISLICFLAALLGDLCRNGKVCVRQ